MSMRMFTDPIAQVVIRDIESGEEWHWGSPAFPFLTNVSFNWEMKAINAFNVGVDIPYDMALEYLDLNKTPFKKNNVVRARIGYARGGFTDWEEGFLVDGGKGLSMGPDGLSGALTVTWISPKVAKYTVSRTMLTDSGMDGVKLLTLIAKEMGLGIDISSQASGNLNEWKLQARPTVLNDRLETFNGFESKDTISVVATICERNNLEYWMGKKKGVKTLFVYTEAEKMKGEASADDVIRKYVIRGILDETKYQYPCYGASPSDDSATWIERTASGAASGVTAYAIDTETGEDVKVEALPQNEETPVEGEIENPPPVDIKFVPENAAELVADAVKGDGTLGSYMSAPVMPSGKKVFENQAKQFGLQGDPAIQMTLDSIGVPEESPGNLCDLYGSGAVFNGRYFIEGMTHNWTPGNWDMNLKVIRRGVKVSTGEILETAGGQMTT